MSDARNAYSPVQPANEPARSTRLRHPRMPRPDAVRHAERMARVFGPELSESGDVLALGRALDDREGAL